MKISKYKLFAIICNHQQKKLTIQTIISSKPLKNPSSNHTQLAPQYSNCANCEKRLKSQKLFKKLPHINIKSMKCMHLAVKTLIGKFCALIRASN